MTLFRISATLSLIAMPAGALHAHVGHLADLAGHDHWVAGAALGVAAAISIWGAAKGKKTEETETADLDEAEEENA